MSDHRSGNGLSGWVVALAMTLAAGLAQADSRRVVLADWADRTLVAEPAETLDLVFRDGTSVLVGPGGTLRIRIGEVIEISGDKAVLRIASGQPGLARPVLITTPTARLHLSSGAGVVVIDGNETRAHLLVGGEMKVTGHGRTRDLYRPGFEVEAGATRLGQPRKMDRSEIVRDLDRIAPGLGTSPVEPRASVAGIGPQVAQSAAAVGSPLAAGMEALNAPANVAEGSPGTITECDQAAVSEPDIAGCLEAIGLALADIDRTGDADAPPVAGGSGNGRDTDTPGPMTPGPMTPGPAAYTDGFGGLGLAGLYANSPGSITVNAEATTTISEGATTDTFQEMSGTFVMSEDDFDGDVRLLFTDRNNQPAGILPGGIGPRRFGPTSNSYFAQGTWETGTAIGAADAMVPSFNATGGGLSYLLGNPALSLNGERILVLRNRDILTSNISGEFAFRSLSGEGVFSAIRVQDDIGSDNDGDPLNDPPDFSNFFSTTVASVPVHPMLAYGLSFGGHFPVSSRQVDNFLFVEAVNAIQKDFAPAPGVASSQPVRDFIGTEDPALVSAETLVRVGQTNQQVFRVTIPDRAASQRLIFATGDIDGLVQNSAGPAQPFIYALSFDPGVVTIDRFQIGTGVQTWFGTPGATGALAVPDPDEATRVAATRSFLRAETWTTLAPAGFLDPSDITDRGVFVINPSAPMVDVTALAATAPGNPVANGADSTLLHADFGLDFVAGRQVSSISATIGSIDFRAFVEDTHGQLDTTNQPLFNISTDAVLVARTIGSSNDGTGVASTLVFSDWASSAAGGGNPNIDLNGDNLADPGRLGFFVVQNAGLLFDDVAGPGSRGLAGGLERPVGHDPTGRPDQAYGALRLGVAVSGGSVPERQPGRFATGLFGYAAGLAEIEIGASQIVGVAPFARIADGPNLTIDAPNLAGNTIAGALAFAGSQIAFGGVRTSAFADDLTWGMLSTTPDTQMAMISAEPVARELRGQFQTESGTEVPIHARDTTSSLGTGIDDAYDYVQWGFFFGDTIATDGSRQHVHLGSFAGGSPISRDVLDTASGQATYTGHAIGNVYNAGAVYTSVGAFAENFDFDRRSGWTDMDFDRRRYSGASSLSGEVYASKVTGGDRTGTLNGRFVGGMSGGQPNALVGGFEIQNASASPGSAYRATGTFAGEK